MTIHADSLLFSYHFIIQLYFIRLAENVNLVISYLTTINRHTRLILLQILKAVIQ